MESTSFIDQGLLTTTRRGRSTAGGMSFEMFPDKYSVSLIEDVSTIVEDDRRNTLRDFSPDTNSLLASDLPRRRTDMTRLKLLETGSRYRYDPYVNPDSNFNISFTDKDSRGATTETNWKEFRRVAENHIRNLDFKNDNFPQQLADNVHPTTIYAKIRATQNDLKVRYKNFQESFEGMGNTGVGVYPNKSRVYKSALNDSLVQNDGEFNDGTEKVVFLHDNVAKLSNILHLGGAFRANTTTDHRVNVTSYGKLYKHKGLDTMNSQLRQVEDDTMVAPGRIKINNVPKNVKRLMSLMAEDTSNTDINRRLMQETMQDAEFHGDPKTQVNRMKILYNILNVMGVSEYELSMLNNDAMSKDVNTRKSAEHTLGNLMEIVDGVNSLTHRQINQLLENITKSNFVDTDSRKNAENSEISAKTIGNILEAKINKSKSKEYTGRPEADTEPISVKTLADANKKSKRKEYATSTADLTEVNNKAQLLLQAVNYKQLSKNMPMSNVNNMQVEKLADYILTHENRNTNDFVETDVANLLQRTALDNEFGEQKSIRRNRAKIHANTHIKNTVSTSAAYDGLNDMKTKTSRTPKF